MLLFFCQFSSKLLNSKRHCQTTASISQRRTVGAQIWPANLLYLPDTLELLLLLAGRMVNVSRAFYISDAFDGCRDPSRHAR